jgi:hypothetical protein
MKLCDLPAISAVQICCLNEKSHPPPRIAGMEILLVHVRLLMKADPQFGESQAAQSIKRHVPP